MRGLLRLLLAAGLLAGLWVLIRELLEGSERGPLQSAGEAARRAAGSAKAAGEAVKDQASSMPSGGGNGTGGLSKAELYRQAQRLDVQGRSKMSKEELARAVAEARGRAQ